MSDPVAHLRQLAGDSEATDPVDALRALAGEGSPSTPRPGGRSVLGTINDFLSKDRMPAVIEGLEQAGSALRHPLDAISGIGKGIAEDFRTGFSAPVQGSRRAESDYLRGKGIDPRPDIPYGSEITAEMPGSVTRGQMAKGAVMTGANLGLAAAPALSLVPRLGINAGIGAMADQEQPVRGAVASLLLGEGLHGVTSAVGARSAAAAKEGALTQAIQDAIEGGSPTTPARRATSFLDTEPASAGGEPMSILDKEIAVREYLSRRGRSLPKEAIKRRPAPLPEREMPESMMRAETFGDTPLTDLPPEQQAIRNRLAAELGIEPEAIGDIRRRPGPMTGAVEPPPTAETQSFSGVTFGDELPSGIKRRPGGDRPVAREVPVMEVVAPEGTSSTARATAAPPEPIPEIRRPVSVGGPKLGEPQPVVSSNGTFEARPGVMRKVNKDVGGPTSDLPLPSRMAGVEEVAPELPQVRSFAGTERGAPELQQQLEAAHEARNVAERQANVDAVTGVANRHAYAKALSAAEQDPATAVVRFDVNGFKGVNDVHGHAVGDVALQDVAKAIQQAAEEHGVGQRVFRVGGDEFAVLAPKETADAIRARAEELYGIQDHGKRVKTSLSGGVGETDAAADAASYAKKQADKTAQGIRARRSPKEEAVSDLLNVSKLNLDQTAEERIAQQLEQHRTLRESERQTFAEADVNRAQIVKDLTGGDPLAISTQAAKKLSGEELLARRDVVRMNDEMIATLSKDIEAGTLPKNEHDQAVALVQKAIEQNDQLLKDLVVGSSQKGRDLNLLRRLANRSLEPETWMVQAKRLLGDKPMTDEIMSNIRKLAREASEACG